jgi:hypothetical protein
MSALSCIGAPTVELTHVGIPAPDIRQLEPLLFGFFVKAVWMGLIDSAVVVLSVFGWLDGLPAWLLAFDQVRVSQVVESVVTQSSQVLALKLVQ